MIEKGNKRKIDCEILEKIFHEIQFQFTNNPPIVTFSDWGASKLGLSKTILNPICNKRIKEIMGKENLKKLRSKILRATPEYPVIQYDCCLTLEKEANWYRITCCRLWTEESVKESLGVVGKVTNIHKEYVQLLELQRMVSHDDLTGLLNHTHVKLKIKEILQSNPDKEFVLMILDLDYFKSANDNYGHIFGDCLLKHVAGKIQKDIRDTDIAARIGGDEFLIFMENGTGIAGRIQKLLNDLTGKYHNFLVSVSIGGAKTTVSERDYDTLFHHADQALYAVKQGGRGYFQFYDNSMSHLLL